MSKALGNGPAKFDRVVGGTPPVPMLVMMPLLQRDRDRWSKKIDELPSKEDKPSFFEESEDIRSGRRRPKVSLLVDALYVIYSIKAFQTLHNK
jgi:hypothetical protein